MMGRQQSLFQYPDQLDFVSEANAHNIIQPAEPLLWRAVMEPWQDFLVSRREDRRFVRMNQYDAAQWLNHQVKCAAIDLCEQQPDVGVRHRKSTYQEYFDFRGEVAFVFKKFT
jgi:hypothetical protein